MSIAEKLFVLVSGFLFVFDFNGIASRDLANLERQCWPHFTNCTYLPMPAGMPSGYSSGYLFAVVLLLVFCMVYSLWRSWDRSAIVILSLLTSFKFFIHFFWQFSGQHNFELFHLLPTIGFLLNSSNRIWGAQVLWSVSYFMAASVKISEAWLAGSYFTPLKLGMPLVHNELIPLVTQGVTLFEIFGSWALLFAKTRKPAFYLWTAFHLYSVSLVGFYYPTRCLAILWVLFLIAPEAGQGVRQRLRPIALVFITLLLVMQTLPHVYDEDPHKTLRFEGYGFEMFGANYQCFAELSYRKGDSPISMRQMTRQARGRCSPRRWMLKAEQICRSHPEVGVRLKLIQSVNGHPFKEVVNLENACEHKFSLFGDNPWLRFDSDLNVGYPKPNSVNDRRVRSASELFSPIEHVDRVRLEAFVHRHLAPIRFFYLLLWSLALTVMFGLYLRLPRPPKR